MKSRTKPRRAPRRLATASGIARTTASHHPAHLRLATQDRALLPTSEGRIWSLYGGASTHRDESGFAGEALRSVVPQLLDPATRSRRPPRCLAWGPARPTCWSAQAVQLIGARVGRTVSAGSRFLRRDGPADERPSCTLAAADAEPPQTSATCSKLRYIDRPRRGRRSSSAPAARRPAVHLALVTGLTEGGDGLQIESPEVDPPGEDSEVLFAPRVWQRPARTAARCSCRRRLAGGQAWLRLQNAVEDGWPEPGEPIEVPEVRTGTLDIGSQLRRSTNSPLGRHPRPVRDPRQPRAGARPDNVAILHQERRLGGDSPLSLVLSQKSGGPADRAIGRSLRAAGIVPTRSRPVDRRRTAEGREPGLRHPRLQAATSGAGINELVGHVVAFSLLATTTTPWPLPPGCRVLLVSLDEYRHWFPGKRADLLAIALDPRRPFTSPPSRSRPPQRRTRRRRRALDQLNQTLAATRWAAYPDDRVVQQAVAEPHRRSRLRRRPRIPLQARRPRGRLRNSASVTGSSRWAGVGLVFGPIELTRAKPSSRSSTATSSRSSSSASPSPSIPRTATDTELATLRTAEQAAPLQATPIPRAEAAVLAVAESSLLWTPPTSAASRHNESSPSGTPARAADDADLPPPGTAPTRRPPRSPERLGSPNRRYDGRRNDSGGRKVPAGAQAWRHVAARLCRPAPGLGRSDWRTGPMASRRAGQDVLQNGHAEIWGSSGMGKTQFAMSLLAS